VDVQAVRDERLESCAEHSAQISLELMDGGGQGHSIQLYRPWFLVPGSRAQTKMFRR